MEDIKILKELIYTYCECEEIGSKKVWLDVTLEQEHAIENILNRLEQDERIIEEMAWHLHIVWDGFAEKEDVIDHFRKKCE